MLLAVGFSPVTANVSNSLGLVPGSVAGAIGYRRELRGQRSRIVRLGGASFAGAIVGAIALLVLPASAFEAIVPIFIGAALVLIALQPTLSRRLAARRPPGHESRGPLAAGVFGTGIYGGYFGAAQGIILISLLRLSFAENLQVLNAIKNVLAATVNLVAGIIFAVVADVDWTAAGLIAIGSTLGGTVGARYGRRLPPAALRAIIVAVGIFAIVRLVVG